MEKPIPRQDEFDLAPRLVKPIPEATPVLNYAVHTSSESATVAQCRTTMEASMLAQTLLEAGIHAQVIDRNTEVLGPYSGGASVRVIVPSQDAALARETIAAARSDDVEPIDAYADAELVRIAAFEKAWQLKEAAVTLAAARIEAFAPKLVPRGDNPPGVGRRFILRVQKIDADDARTLFRDLEADAPERRCARCGCERIVEEMNFWQFFRDLFCLIGPPRECTCMGCQYRGVEADFAETNWLRNGIVEED